MLLGSDTETERLALPPAATDPCWGLTSHQSAVLVLVQEEAPVPVLESVTFLGAGAGTSLPAEKDTEEGERVRWELLAGGGGGVPPGAP